MTDPRSAGSSRLLAVRFDTADPAVTGAFWAGLLGRQAVDEQGAVLLPGDATQVGLRFVRSSSPKPARNRLHLHVTTQSGEGQRRTVDTVLRLGGRRRGTGALPYGRDIYLADPGGDEFCVIEPGNAYLEGCGLLGEVTCEGSPAAGRFWRDALGWPLVWDQDEQTVIQSPAGGTKIAWDGRSDPGAAGWNRQRFDLVASDPDSEVERLVGLGATRLGAEGDTVTLLDPDGSECSVARS